MRTVIFAFVSWAVMTAAPTGSAVAAVIDFQALEHATAGQQVVPGTGKFYAENGYEFASSAPVHNFATWGTLSANYLGSTALWNGDGTGVTGVTTLTRTGGGAFDLQSIDIGELTVSGPGVATVNFVGALFGGGTVSQSFTSDGVRATGSGFETVLFAGFTDVVSVSWLQVSPFIQFDNVTVASASIPEPAAALVLALAFLGLRLTGPARHRTRSSQPNPASPK